MKPTTSVTALLVFVAALLFEQSSGVPRLATLDSSKPRSKPIRKNFFSNQSRQQQKQQQRGRALVRPQNNAATNPKGGDAIQVLDYGAMLKYVAALAVQATLSVGMWRGIDWVVARSPTTITDLPGWAKFVAVYFLNPQVGRFNPLPTVSERVGGDLSPGRKRPSWTPPGWVFVLMWPLFVFGTRAYALVAIASEVGGFANPVTASMMLHFAFGGLWSHVNRIEQQLGFSMLLLYALFFSKAYTAYLAYRIVPGAGIALACTLSWLLAAAALGTDTWRLNPDPKTGKRQPLLPRKAKQQTPEHK